MPIAAAALVLIPALLPMAPAVSGQVDLAGALTVTGDLGLGVFAVVCAPEAGWASAVTITALSAAVVLLVAFLAIEARRRSPLVRLGIFRTPNLVAGLEPVSTATSF